MTTNDVNANGYKVLTSRLTAIEAMLRDMQIDQKSYHEQAQRERAQNTIKVALLEQSMSQVCSDIEKRDAKVEKLEERMDKQDNVNKIVGAATAMLYAIAGIFGFTQS